MFIDVGRARNVVGIGNQTTVALFAACVRNVGYQCAVLCQSFVNLPVLAMSAKQALAAAKAAGHP